jgi:hypothetical protein
VLQTEAVLPILDAAILGSPYTAERLLALIEPYLTNQDEAIQAAFPFWRDLVRYQATLFRVEAEGDGQARSSGHPQRARSCRLLDLDWDLPDLLQQLRTIEGAAREMMASLVGKRVPTTLLVAGGAHGRITTVRCDHVVRRILESADGTRDEAALAAIAGIPRDQATQLLNQLDEMGAIA